MVYLLILQLLYQSIHLFDSVTHWVFLFGARVLHKGEVPAFSRGWIVGFRWFGVGQRKPWMCLLWARTHQEVMVPKMCFHFPLMFHPHLCYWSIGWQFPSLCETSFVNILKVNFYNCGFLSFVVEEGEAVLKAVSFS